MKNVRAWRACALAVLALACAATYADDREDYYRRAAARDAALFQSLDLDRDGTLTRAEARGDLALGPRFDDVDIDRDGIMTREELQRYVEQRYGVKAQPAATR